MLDLGSIFKFAHKSTFLIAEILQQNFVKVVYICTIRRTIRIVGNM